MAPNLPESNSAVLEDGDAALIEGSTEAEIVEDVNADSTEEEIVDFAAMTSESKKEAPAAAKPEPTAPAAKAPAKKSADDIPQELLAKTPAELARMYREAQALIGRQGQELGEYRKRVDRIVEKSLSALAAAKGPTSAGKPAEKPADPIAEMEESEIFAKPKDAISKLIENHPVIQGIKQQLGQAAAVQAASRANAAVERFNQAHPDAEQVFRDPEFRKWVAASPIRQRLFVTAHRNFDFAAGDELFSTWKALRGVGVRSSTEGTTESAKQDVSAAASTLAKAAAAKRAAAAQAAAAPTGGASASKAGGAKKIYRRADVLRLMEEQPERYEMMADEIAKAYAEGRVR